MTERRRPGTPPGQMPRWVLGGLVLVSGAYFQTNPVIRFNEPAPGTPLTGLEVVANLLVAATVATFAFIAVRALSRGLQR
jgi:hypothetical protein